jgi:hypothetical protein
MEIETTCPSCGETLSLMVDVTAGSRQRYVEDCWVCCRPMDVVVTVRSRDDVDVEVHPSDE